jgi:uncharacterized membrane protein YedE/YeeE
MSTSWGALIAGGALIGLAASLLLAANGRIAGISGIYGRLLEGDIGKGGWQLAFLAGLLTPVLVMQVPVMQEPPAWGVMAAAGLLVGLGTRIGSGCTSGHGVCGIANLSPRSLAATVLFMAAAMATVYAVRHL